MSSTADTDFLAVNEGSLLAWCTLVERVLRVPARHRRYEGPYPTYDYEGVVNPGGAEAGIENTKSRHASSAGHREDT